ncbi:MAG: 3-hydroxybutyryl-CoA dehydrogenase [Halanaerobiales bacterium]|nr:3-hydroxybutyryl-CoA dehydrogenase [Halanaerobiales bacterium]
MVEIKTIAVIGAGVMGTGLAEDLAGHGYNVILKDISEDVLQSSRDQISQDLRLLKMTKKEFRSLTEEDFLSRIKFTTDYSGFEEVDFVIENITEDIDAKTIVYKELVEVCREDVVYGVNTSCISITKIGSIILDASKAIGMHFMNPVPMKKLVETVKDYHTSEETIETAVNLVNSLGKEAVIVNDYPGFVTNRVLMLTINECVFLVQDKVAEPKDIDKIFRLGFAHKMGPLVTADLIGLDTILNSLMVLYESYNDSKYRPCPLLKKMVDAGLLGRKSGQGFFTYKK